MWIWCRQEIRNVSEGRDGNGWKRSRLPPVKWILIGRIFLLWYAGTASGAVVVNPGAEQGLAVLACSGDDDECHRWKLKDHGATYCGCCMQHDLVCARHGHDQISLGKVPYHFDRCSGLQYHRLSQVLSISWFWKAVESLFNLFLKVQGYRSCLQFLNCPPATIFVTFPFVSREIILVLEL